LTQANAIMGTPDYLAPEQANDARSADIRADIYSLGCTFYHLLTGRPPFADVPVLQKLICHLDQPPPPVSDFRGDVPPDLVAVLDRMLAKDLGQRYQTPAEVARALLPFITPAAQPPPEKSGERQAEPTTPEVPVEPPPPVPAQGDRSPVWAFGIAAVVLGGGILASAVMFLTGPSSAPTAPAPPPVANVPKPTSSEVERKDKALPPAVGRVTLERDAPDVRLVFSRGGTDKAVLDPKSQRELELPPGTYRVELAEPRADRRPSPSELTVVAGGRHVVRVETVVPAVRKGRLVLDRNDVAVIVKRQGKKVAETVNGQAELPPDREAYELAPADARRWRVSPDRITVTPDGRHEVKLVREPTFLGHSQAVGCVAVSPDGRSVLSGGSDGKVILWDVETKEPKRPPFNVHKGQVRAVAFSPSGRYAVSGGFDGKAHCWDLQTGNLVRVLEKGQDRIQAVVCVSDSQALIAGSDKAVYWWDFQAGKDGVRFSGHAFPIASLAYQPKLGWAVSGAGKGGGIRLWDVNNGKDEILLKGKVHHYLLKGTHEGTRVHSLAFHPREPLLVLSGGHDGLMELWHLDNAVKTQKPEVVFNHKKEPVFCVAFSPDGTRAFSACRDGLVRMWDVRNGAAPLKVFNGHQDWVLSLAADPAGRFVISGGRDGTIRQWVLP
jgi:WD40 repeat protein